MLRISFINVGYGDSILIEEMRGTKRTFAMLIDAGAPYEGPYRRDYEAKSDRVPAPRYLAARDVDKLDIVFLTHFHIDHVGGMPDLLRSIPFGEFWANFRPTAQRGNTCAPLSSDALFSLESRARPESLAMRRSLELLADSYSIATAAGAEIAVVENHRFDVSLTADISIDLYAPSPAAISRMRKLGAEAGSKSPAEAEPALYALDKSQNASCAAMRLSYKGFSALFAADLPHPYWNSLIDAGRSIRADLLKFPHHGQEDGASHKFADAVAPKDVVFCVSEDNPFRCPSRPVFSHFRKETRYHSTGSIDLRPELAPHPASEALVFEISDDGVAREVISDLCPRL
jgi:beta-lactamase superfamily II metal-dependent hydrolase